MRAGAWLAQSRSALCLPRLWLRPRPTELFIYLAAVLAVVVASVMVGDKGPQTPDPFNAVPALRYITFLTMVSRGLAKAGVAATATTDPLFPPKPTALAGSLRTGMKSRLITSDWTKTGLVVTPLHILISDIRHGLFGWNSAGYSVEPWP